MALTEGVLHRQSARPGFLYAMRRFEIGPLLVAVAALVLLVSLFLEWYAGQTAWDAFEVADVMLALFAVLALVAAAGLIAPELAYLDRGVLPAAAIAATVLTTAEILSPPPGLGGADPEAGAWIAFAASLVMLAGTVLSFGRVSFSVAVEGREPRQRVAAVDHRPPTTETGAVVPQPAAEPEPEPEPETAATVADEPEHRPGRSTTGRSTTGRSRRGERQT
jgi:hypothetical protein